MSKTIENPDAEAVDLDRLVRLLGRRLRVRKHAPNFVGNTHTATIKGEGVYGAGKSPQEARWRLYGRLKEWDRLNLYMPNND